MKHVRNIQKYLETLKLAEECARYIVNNKATIRGAAEKFHVSKTFVHRNIEKFLSVENVELYQKTRIVIEENKRERSIRGGMATKKMYMERRKNAY